MMKPNGKPPADYHEDSYAWLFKRQVARTRIRVIAFILAIGAVSLLAWDSNDNVYPVRKKDGNSTIKTSETITSSHGLSIRPK